MIKVAEFIDNRLAARYTHRELRAYTPKERGGSTIIMASITVISLDVKIRVLYNISPDVGQMCD